MTLQVVVRRRPRLKVYLRALPVTAESPKDAQLERRSAFGEAATEAKGKRGLAPDGLPWAAHHVKERLRGTEAPRELRVVRVPKWREELEGFRLALELLRRLAAPRASQRSPPKSYT